MCLSLIRKDADLVLSHRSFGPFLQSATSMPDLEAGLNRSCLLVSLIAALFFYS
jgi:hypothetical protein